MSDHDPVELYRRATARAVDVAYGVRPDQLASSTPCSEWTVQDLLDHLVTGTVYLAAALGSDPAGPPTPGTAPDLALGVERCLAQMADPVALAHRSDSPLGFEWSGVEATAGTFMDVLVHTWDLATATGQDAALAPDLVAACTDMFLPGMPDQGRQAGIIGPAIDVAPDASPQDQLLAAMGRQP